MTSKSHTQSKSQEEAPKYDFNALLDVLKSVGIVIGSLGSVAILFFWIGNAIIVARLRAYNLYGIVHYTDEYVTEAGYQFFQDIFTFFQDWKLILLFAMIMAVTLVMIPVGGPVSGKEEGEQRFHWTKSPISLVRHIRRKRIHYPIFLLLALSASTILTTDWFVRRLSSDIIRQERLLADIAEDIKGKLLILIPNEKGRERATEFQKRFYEELTIAEKPTREWLEKTLSEHYAIQGDSHLLMRFQEDFDIHEAPDFKFDGDFEQSQTFRTLLSVQLSKKITRELDANVAKTLEDFRTLLSGHLKSDGDTSSLVLIPANYDTANNSISRLIRMRTNVLTFFNPEDDDTKKIFKRLKELKPIAFGQCLISYSFWILIGVLAYLILSSPRLLQFRQWEIGYFILMMLLFLAILITLPTAYGRYKFEFKMQKLNDIIFTEDEKTNITLGKKLEELKSKHANLYILGPTKGREVIIGAIQAPVSIGGNVPQIIMLEREKVKYMNLEPVRPEDIPAIIQLLRQQVEPAKKELLTASAVH